MNESSMAAPKGVPTSRRKAIARVLAAALCAAMLSFAGSSTASNAATTTIVSLTFNDGVTSDYTYARPVLEAHNVNATFYLASGQIDKSFSCCMPWWQVDNLYRDGNEIGGMGSDHASLTDTSTTLAYKTQEVCGDRQRLQTLGYDPQSFAYPQAAVNATAESIVSGCGYLSGRTIGGLPQNTTPYAETVPPKDAYSIRTANLPTGAIQLSTLENAVTAASTHGGGWLPIAFNQVCDAADPNYSTCMGTSKALDDGVFGQFLTWLQTSGQPGGAPAGISIQTVRQVMGAPPQPPLPPRPLTVSLTFDDGDVSQVQTGPMLAAHNLHATYFIPSADKQDTWDQIQNLYADGNEIGGHTVDHVDLTDPNTTNAYKVHEVCDDRQTLISHGFNPISFAYPFGTYDANAESIVQSCGYLDARRAGGSTIDGPTYAETIPPQNAYTVRTEFRADTTPLQLSDLTTPVQNAASHGGGWLVFVFHEICNPSASDYSTCMSTYKPTSTDTFNQFLDWLNQNAPPSTTVKTMGQVMTGVTTPPPAPTITGQPPSLSNSTTGTFSFNDTQAGVTFQCAVDGQWEPCSSPYTTPAVADGTHTFQVEAHDTTGNASGRASYTWTVDTAPPPPPSFTGTQPGKLAVIVLENKSVQDLVGNPDAPYFNSLIANGEYFTNYNAVQSSSNPNYLAMTSGQTAILSPPPPNIFQAIDATGGALTWKEYMESMPGNCAQGTYDVVPGTTDTLYTADHDPGYQYRNNISCATNDVPMTSGSFDPAHLPDLSYIIPNECDDMHTLPANGQACPAYFGSNGGTNQINMGDNWLAHVVPQLLAQPNVTVLVTFDEGGDNEGEHIVTLLTGAGVTPGATDGTAYNHYGLAAGLYNYFGLGAAPNNAATATPLPIPGINGSLPHNLSNDTTPSFTFTDAEASDTFQCSLDGAPYTVCSSPDAVGPLSDGKHSFSIESVDSAGNASSPTTYKWTVKTSLPATPSIDTFPPNPSNQPRSTFAFSDSDNNITFQCSVDGGGFTSCTSPFTTSALNDGQHTFAVQAQDGAGNLSSAATYGWTIDTVPPPQPTLDSAPPNPSNNPQPTFQFSDTEASATLQCSLDGSAFATCTSPLTTSTLADGSHTFTVEAVDAAGNVSPPASDTWTVKTTAPPVPTIGTEPASQSNQSQSTFSFSDGDGTATFACSVDGSLFLPCTTPFGTGSLTDGGHTFAVHAIDTAGNVSNDATYAWTIDTVPPPQPSLDSMPTNPSNNPQPSFQFSDSEGSATLQCSLDGSKFATCTSPLTTPTLADGPHTFAVQAVDAAGNISTAATYSWTVNTARPPAPTLTSTPANPSNQSQPTFQFSDTASNVTFECNLDGSGFSACTSPNTTTSLADGSHTFAVHAIDGLGNVSTATTYGWTVDTVPPPSPSITSTPPAFSGSGSAQFAFTDTETGAAFECQLDGSAFTACLSPTSYTGLTSGQHTFAVRARDAAGNPSTASTYTWTVQLTAPPAPTLTSTPSNPSNVTQPAFAFSDTESGVTFQCRVDSATFAACTSPYTTAALANGSHTFQVRAVDILARTSAATSYTWTIDTVAPPAPTLSSKPPATSASNSGSFAFSDKQTGVTFQCQMDNGGYNTCTSPAPFSGLSDGSHTFAVRARDAAGNVSTSTTYTWTIDTTPPAQPAGLSASVTSVAVTLTWNANTETDLAGYNVYRGSSASGPFTKLNSTLLTTATYQDTAATAATTAYYQVQAVDKLGNASTPAQTSVNRGIVFRSASSAGAATASSLTITKPTGTASGDVLVAAISVAGQATVTAPTGWTLVRSTPSGTTETLNTYVHVAGTTEPTSYVWSFSSSRTVSGLVAAYIGVNTTTPVDVSAGQAGSSSTSVTEPSVTTTGAGELLIGVLGAAVNANVTPPTGMIEQAEKVGGTGNTRALSELADLELGAAGATGNRIASLSSAGVNAGQLIALRPSQ